MHDNSKSLKVDFINRTLLDWWHSRKVGPKTRDPLVGLGTLNPLRGSGCRVSLFWYALKKRFQHNFPKAPYAIILKQSIRTIRPMSAPVYVLSQVSASFNVSKSSNYPTQRNDSLLQLLQCLGVSNQGQIQDEAKKTIASSRSEALGLKIQKLDNDNPANLHLEKFNFQF